MIVVVLLGVVEVQERVSASREGHHYRLRSARRGRKWLMKRERRVRSIGKGGREGEKVVVRL